ncbi:hypothetical protein ABK046_49650, partial [Streptomyces caeruleatus]
MIILSLVIIDQLPVCYCKKNKIIEANVVVEPWAMVVQEQTSSTPHEVSAEKGVVEGHSIEADS